MPAAEGGGCGQWQELEGARVAAVAVLRLAQRRKRPESSRLPRGIFIAGRPGIVDQRRRFGDWEGDTIVGCGQRGGLVSLVERTSGYTLLARVDNRGPRPCAPPPSNSSQRWRRTSAAR